MVGQTTSETSGATVFILRHGWTFSGCYFTHLSLVVEHSGVVLVGPENWELKRSDLQASDRSKQRRGKWDT